VETPVEIAGGDGSRLTIIWSDGRVDHLSAHRLRAACPCAACQGAGVVPAGATVARIRPIGGYAIAFEFHPDGHSSGIYSFELLRALGAEAA
jgi:ATP-binding protein involved in chromosome partitioning